MDYLSQWIQAEIKIVKSQIRLQRTGSAEKRTEQLRVIQRNMEIQKRLDL